MPRWLIKAERSKEAEGICQEVIIMKCLEILYELNWTKIHTRYDNDNERPAGKEKHINKRSIGYENGVS